MSDTTAVTEQDESQETEYSAEALAREIAELTWDRKGLNTTIIDLRGRVSYTDYIVLSTATSDRQIQAIARHVERSLRDLGYRTLSTEGIDSGRWALLDFGDVILHVFSQEGRKDYDLDSMWSDATRIDLEDRPDTLYGHFDMDQFG